MVTAVICCYPLLLAFEGKSLTYFVNMIGHLYFAARLVDSVELFGSTALSFLSRYHGYHIFLRFFFRLPYLYFEKAMYLLIK